MPLQSTHQPKLKKQEEEEEEELTSRRSSLSVSQRLRQALEPVYIHGLEPIKLPSMAWGAEEEEAEEGGGDEARQSLENKQRRVLDVYRNGGSYTLSDVALDSMRAVLVFGIGDNIEFEYQLAHILHQRQGRDVPFFAYDPYAGNFSLDEVQRQPNMLLRLASCSRFDDASGDFETLTLLALSSLF
jgi:hypothetical protein